MAACTEIDLQAEFSDRFFFWTGASGKRYIHSVYAVDDCPPLPGAVFIEVMKLPCGNRKAVRAGRFPPFWDVTPATSSRGRSGRVSEVHVHLLASDDKSSESILADLLAGLGLEDTARNVFHARPADGFAEQASLPLFAGLAA